MEKVSKYQANAEECRRLASGTSNEDHRVALLKMAETWEGLALELTELLLQQTRIADLERLPEHSLD
jgi:hypothetical protein